MTPKPAEPVGLLAAGVESLAAGLQADGTLHDPVFDCPTQYGGAYFAWCCAVLAQIDPTQAELWCRRSDVALRAALVHTSDPRAEPYASGFDTATLSVTGRMNHRDFTWPPILRCYLRDPSAYANLVPALRDANVPAIFRARPPSNWAAVWLSGEWLRMSAGLSPTSPEQFDAWLDPFFEGVDGTGFDVTSGMYRERGLPNAYDLFTRLHLVQLLRDGYAGRHRAALEHFLTTGLRRSLELQLSDGSLASGYRSSGQTWVLGAQIALFTSADRLGLGTEADRVEGRLAAWRAYSSLSRWQRPDGVFSPVQNTLAPELRIGYEGYTADGHYSPLALAFLASAVLDGFGDPPHPSVTELDGRPPRIRTEPDLTGGGTAHLGRISIGVHTRPDPAYDCCCLVDATFGAGRLLQLVSPARHVAGGPWLVPGLAVRARAGADLPTALCAVPQVVVEPLSASGSAGLTFASRLGAPLVGDQPYRFGARLHASGVEVVEETPGFVAHQTLVLPYPVDLGSDRTTVVEPLPDGVRLRLGTEWLEVTVASSVERRSVLTSGYANRRGLCGLVRLDLAEPAETLRWRITSSP